MEAYDFQVIQRPINRSVAFLSENARRAEIFPDKRPTSFSRIIQNIYSENI